MSETLDRIEGVVIGVFLGFDGEAPLVVFSGNPRETAVAARSLMELSSEMIGSEVALLFQRGDPGYPLIVGRIIDPMRKQIIPETKKDDSIFRIVARDRIEFRCGKSTIVMEKDGHITIRGSYLTSHASATNRIRGGSINLN